MQQSIRLNKFLAKAGVASRRHADELIAAGRVSIDGKAVRELGTLVEPGSEVRVDGTPVAPPEE
ncbi:MAG TPA: S4 domain-containing protein, partial [Candidatus Cybelea sp.]